MGVQADAFAILLAEHGRYATRKPHPAGAQVTNIRVLWMEDHVDRRVNDSGERTTRTGRIQVIDRDDLDETDHWVVLSEEWIQRQVSSLDEGIRTVYLQRDDKVTTKQPGRNKV